MTKIIRKCRLADSSHRDVDLRIYEDIIIDTINKTVPRKNPAVYKDSFVTDKLTQSGAVALGRALAKIDELIDAGFSLWEIEDYIYMEWTGRCSGVRKKCRKMIVFSQMRKNY